MEIVALAIVWPLILLLIGLVFVSSSSISSILLVPVALAFFILVFGFRERLGTERAIGEKEQLDQLRRGVVTFSIAVMLPMFAKYLLALSHNDLSTMILALALGFGAIIWGMFVKGNKVLAYANSIGGALTIIYLYIQLWQLGQLSQIIATAFGLVVAIVISVVKFREKLT